MDQRAQAGNYAAARAAPDASHYTPPWRFVAASVTGVKHRRAGQPCQDACRYAALPTGEAVIAVADGAGSARHAACGAQLVVDAALRAVTDHLAVYAPMDERGWQTLVTAAFRAAQKSVQTHAKTASSPMQAYAATLVLLILSAEWTVGGLVGDCVAVVQPDTKTGDQEFISLCPPQRGEYANATYFVTHPRALDWLDVQVLHAPVQNAAVLSDGLLELAMNVAENRPFAPFFDPLFGFMTDATQADTATAELARFLDSARVNARTRDDKTLVLVRRI